MEFYVCRHCGNVVCKLTDAQVPIHCCGRPMEVLVPGVTDGAAEKHLPAVTVEDQTVRVNVGAVTHPMTQEHFIQWAVVETAQSAQIHWFRPDEAPEAEFALPQGETATAVYAYCNLHGLWKQAL